MIRYWAPRVRFELAGFDRSPLTVNIVSLRFEDAFASYHTYVYGRAGQPGSTATASSPCSLPVELPPGTVPIVVIVVPPVQTLMFAVRCSQTRRRPSGRNASATGSVRPVVTRA